jgi:hypothetical protein
MVIEVAFNFIYITHYSGWVNDFFDISLTINMVHELNYQLLTC